jgi:hypothetical protein
MAKAQKIRLIAAATAFVALSLPGSSSAQSPGQILGTWTGYDSVEISVFDFSSGQLLSSYSGSGPATLSMEIDYMVIAGGGAVIIGTGPYNPPDPFGPTSASGIINFNGGPAGSTIGNFFLTYESILPNGQIDVGNGSAVADLTTIEYDFESPVATVTESFATFTTVPEPPSRVLAGLAILVMAAIAGARRFRRSVQTRLS